VHGLALARKKRSQRSDEGGRDLQAESKGYSGNGGCEERKREGGAQRNTCPSEEQENAKGVMSEGGVRSQELGITYRWEESEGNWTGKKGWSNWPFWKLSRAIGREVDREFSGSNRGYICEREALEG